MPVLCGVFYVECHAEFHAELHAVSYNECLSYAECFMLSVMLRFMVTMLSVFMLIVVILSVIMMIVVILSVRKLECHGEFHYADCCHTESQKA